LEKNNNMSFNRKKSTKRFDFAVSRDTSHRAGSNTFTITSKPIVGGRYTTPTGDGVTMSVKEAMALRGFLNSYLGGGTGSGTDTNN